ncbi:hypothetical protein GCM10010174_30450 [Kutzneria viridogrisea]|uniref:Uncharacterized protein n=2 Tax=Kutzneria TaxID=43356 RepID=W5VYG5_9PSEU|nr:hypothetical protein [Kutzneria albida]AHH93612.1 hypothetical protein KALB_235 [Kutzneria albida DSM 43870]MBA8929004.1 hypothetical protein [Kutzneria viridogrisea]
MAENTRTEIDIELFGGPEDGRTIKVPAQNDGVPVLPRWEFPQLPKERDRQKLKQALAASPVVVYERPAEPTHGRWKYVYAGTRARS